MAHDNFSTNYTSTLPPAQPAPQIVIQQQDQVIRQQDQALDQLSASVATLHRMGNEIHGELTTQVRCLLPAVLDLRAYLPM